MFELFQQYVVEKPEWWTATVVFWVIGHFMETSVFTKVRAQTGRPKWFWQWGKESMELHPIVAGALLGFAHNGIWWGLSAGVSSLFFWKILSLMIQKRYGKDAKFTLPGESEPPKS